MHEPMMRAALEEARLALESGEVPVGAVVARGGEIVAAAHNEREKTGDPTAHAEVLALRRAAAKLGRRRLRDCTLYVTLEPCPMCAGAAVMAQIGSIYFGAYDPKCGCAGSVYALPEDAAFSAYAPCMGGLLEEECRAQLDAFFGARRQEETQL